MINNSRMITHNSGYVNMSQFKNEITGKYCWFIGASDQSTIKLSPPYSSMVIYFDHPKLQSYLYDLFSHYIKEEFSKILKLVRDGHIEIDNNLLISNFIKGGLAT